MANQKKPIDVQEFAAKLNKLSCYHVVNARTGVNSFFNKREDSLHSFYEEVRLMPEFKTFKCIEAAEINHKAWKISITTFLRCMGTNR